VIFITVLKEKKTQKFLTAPPIDKKMFGNENLFSSKDIKKYMDSSYATAIDLLKQID